ncbi:MAG: hypothetical protein JXN59_00945 [Anaerolineae bacterium]|nr:hypothetical protein [Anaerolineae bacterium]
MDKRAFWQPWVIIALVALIYLGAVLAANNADPLVFVTLGTRFGEQQSGGAEGYDGQFTYHIARDPEGAASLIDVPAYRYQRILLPLLARVLALGQPGLIPWALVGINLAALLVSTALLGQLLAGYKANQWYALVYGLFPGVLMAVRLSLNEPLAYGLVIGAWWLYTRDRKWLAFGALALAALAKETTLLFTAGFILCELASRRWSTALLGGSLSVLPFAIWQVVLYRTFGAFGVGSGGALATPFEIIPFNGFWRIYTDTGSLRVFVVFALLLIPAVIVPSLWGLWQSAQDILKKRQTCLTYLLLLNAAVMPFVPFSTYREPLGILRFIVGLVICVVVYAAAKHNRRALRYSTLWLVLLAFIISSG